MTADQLINQIISYEGEDYDPSGPSKYGILLDTYRAVTGLERATAQDIKSMSREEAEVIYYQCFYESYMSELPSGTALLVFDTIVQHGQGRGTKMIQTAIADPSEVKVDGILGPITQKYLGEIRGTRFASKLLALRFKSYTKNENNDKKIRGLANRLFKLALDANMGDNNGISTSESRNDSGCAWRYSDDSNSDYSSDSNAQ